MKITHCLAAFGFCLSHLAMGATYYVATNGNDAAQGTLADPFATIAKAYALSASNDVVSVGPGTYVIPKVGGATDAWLTMDKAVTIISQQGPEKTILDGQNVDQNRAFMLSHPMAAVAGFTVCRMKVNIDWALKLSGVVHVLSGTITNCIIRNNTQNYLAAVTLAGGTAVDCTIRDNVISDSLSLGAGLYLTGASARAIRCVVSGNSGTRGAGLYCDSATAEATACRFETNVMRSTTRLASAAVHLDNGTVQHSIVRGNNGFRSGGVFIAAGNLRNSVIYGNVDLGTIGGGGVHQTGGAIDGCTIAGNRAALVTTGHGLYQNGGTVKNTIVAYNGAAPVFTDTGNYYWVKGTRTQVCAYPGQSGDGNLSQDPCFVDILAADYRLSPASPCRDAGSASAWMAGAEDAFGNARIRGSQVDIGAHEMTPVPELPFVCDIVVPETTLGLAPLTISFTAAVFNPPPGPITYLWSFGNGQTATGATVSHTFDTGRHPGITLTVTADGQSTARTLPNTILAGALNAYVATNGASVWPYHMAASAATNLQDAIGAIVLPTYAHRGTVRVAAGTYVIRPQANPLQPNITLDRPIALIGAGPGATIIDGKAVANNRGILLMHTNAAVVGMTLRRVSSTITSMEEGGTLHVANGMVSNCVVENCVATTYGSPVLLKEGLITHCLLATNTAQDSLSEGGAIRINGGGRLRDSRLVGNKGVLGCGLYLTVSSTAAIISGCVFEDNVASGSSRGQSGALYLLSGTVERCIVRNNTGRKGGGAWLSGGTIRNSLFVGNSDIQNAMGGGGVHMAGGTVESCTIAGNGATTAGAAGGVYLGVAAAVLRNSIAWDNDVSDVKLAAGSVTYTCSGETLAGAGNRSDNPLFRDAARGDFALRSASPYINAGLVSAWMTTATDLAGNPRVTFASVDYGAYESTVNRGTVLFMR